MMVEFSSQLQQMMMELSSKPKCVVMSFKLSHHIKIVYNQRRKTNTKFLNETFYGCLTMYVCAPNVVGCFYYLLLIQENRSLQSICLCVCWTPMSPELKWTSPLPKNYPNMWQVLWKVGDRKRFVLIPWFVQFHHEFLQWKIILSLEHSVLFTIV